MLTCSICNLPLEADRQVMRRAVDHIIPETLWIVSGDERDDHLMPITRSREA